MQMRTRWSETSSVSVPRAACRYACVGEEAALKRAADPSDSCQGKIMCTILYIASIYKCWHISTCRCAELQTVLMQIRMRATCPTQLLAAVF